MGFKEKIKLPSGLNLGLDLGGPKELEDEDSW